MAVDRLGDLRAVAGVTVKQVSFGVTKPAEWDAEGFRALLADEAAVLAALTSILTKVQHLKDAAAEATDAVLPSQVQQLASQFAADEQTCIRIIRRSKVLLATLRRGDLKTLVSTKEETAGTALSDIRTNLADRYSRDFKEHVQVFFATRGSYHDEVCERSRRQLMFAYPDASDEEIQEALMSPTWATAAIARRVEEGDTCPHLEKVIKELVDKDGSVALLAESAAGLKAMFLQFAELVNEQDITLDAIESNIQNTMKKTEETIEILHDAYETKEQIEALRKRMLCCFTTFVLVLLIILWFWFKCPGLGWITVASKEKGGTEKPAAGSSLQLGALECWHHLRGRGREPQPQQRLSPDMLQLAPY